MWNEIRNDSDIQKFMKLNYNFHDSCIKELKYTSGAYVKDNWMHPINSKRILTVIIHGSFDRHSAIEMEFSGLEYINLNPVDEKYSCEIFGATMLIKNFFIYWCDDDCVTLDNIDNYSGTVICASKLRWRYADEYMGEDEVFIPVSR